jgi:hypothetical protein
LTSYENGQKVKELAFNCFELKTLDILPIVRQQAKKKQLAIHIFGHV